MFVLSSFDSGFTVMAVIGLMCVLIGYLLRIIKQPYLIGYILVGIFIGKHGLAWIENTDSIHFLGELGIIFLFFFIGMHVSLQDFIKQWKVAVLGTMFQILFSLCILLILGHWFGWPIVRSIVLGFVIALSSSAVIIKVLEDKKLLDEKVGKNVLSILLTQDIAIAPILIITSFLGGETETIGNIILKITGGVLIVSIMIYLYRKDRINLPFQNSLIEDHELQVFIALFLCFGGALFTSLFGLSPAIGAFIGGMIVHAARQIDWIYDALHSFRVLFVAVFFISIGLQIDLNFILQNAFMIGIVLVAVYITNHLINSFILKAFNSSWKEAIYGGAMLAQIGEMSFLICSTAFYSNIIGDFGYKFTISLISLTLFISPFWIALTEKLLFPAKKSIN